jgi:hypothetical protein
LDLLRRAREEGVAVDLDDLAAIGREYDEAEAARNRSNSSRSFDDIVGSDGMLHGVDVPERSTAQTSGAYSEGQNNVRNRGAGSRGLDAGSLYANPFSDEAQILLDLDETSPDSKRSRESSRTLSPAPVINSSESQSEYFSEEEIEAQIEEAIRRSLENVSEAPVDDAIADPPVSIPIDNDSYYYAPPPNVRQPPVSTNSLYASAIESILQDHQGHDVDTDGHQPPVGTLTPTDDGFSMAGSVADDVGVMSDLLSIAESVADDIDDHMSEGGYTTDYSMAGASTPGSWTDVESEAGDEAHNGHHIVYNPPVSHS